MSQEQPLFQMPEGMSCGNEEAFIQKVAHFAGSGAADVHIIWDFDRTLTVSHPETQEDVTTWQILCEHLSEKGQAQYNDLFQRYRSMELEERMTVKDAVDWWSSILGLYVEERVSMTEVDADFLMRASIRRGAHEVFSLCKEQEIPNVIMSAGIRDVIDVWSHKYDIQPSLTLSTILKLDSDNRIVGWDEDSLVHTLNKHELDHEELTSIRSKRPKIIVVGDGMGDADMARGDVDVLRIRIFDPRPDEIFDISDVRRRTFEKFDVMIESGTLHPLLTTLKLICGTNSFGPRHNSTHPDY